MSEDKQIAVARAEGNFSLAMLSKVKGLDENSPLRKLQGNGALRLTVDSNNFQIKKGAKVIQVIKDLENPKKNAKELDVVIHMVSPLIQKQAAVKWDPKDPKFEPIGCWSNDGNTPDEDAWNKQSGSCDTCKFGKGADAKDSASGKMASCGLTRLAVVSIYSPLSEPDDIELMLMNFNWSSNSTKKNGEDKEENQLCMINYLNLLMGMEVDTHKVVTRLLVDDWSDNTPANNSKLLFQPVGILKDGDPNAVAHAAWMADPAKDLEDMVKITQRKPQDAADDLEDGGAPQTKKKAASKKKVSSKKKATAKKAPVPLEEEELDLDELEQFGEECPTEVEGAEVEEELVAEDDDDFSLDELLED